jgi:hypothetical protein
LPGREAARDVNIYTTSETLAWQLWQISIDNGISCALQAQQRTVTAAFSQRYQLEAFVHFEYKGELLHLLYPCKVGVPTQKHTRQAMENTDYFYTPIRAI